MLAGRRIMTPISQPPPPPKKSNVLLWVLVGIGGFFLLIALAVVGGIAYVARNPTMVMTKLITASNPNVEVVSVDKGSQRITLHDKKTGKTYNISFNDAKNGKFTVNEDGGSRAAFSIGGKAKVPAWIPDYPGSDPQAAFTAQGDEGESGTFTFKTRDSMDRVSKYYQDQFKSSGLEITTNVTHQDGQSSTGTLVAQDQAKRHTITVTIGGDGGNSTVAVTYATSK
jgi:hypothetical protein